MQGPTSVPLTGATTYLELFEAGAGTAGPSANALGRRKVNADGTFGEYMWESFGEISKRTKDFASGLKHLNLVPIVDSESTPLSTSHIPYPVCYLSIRCILFITRNE